METIRRYNGWIFLLGVLIFLVPSIVYSTVLMPIIPKVQEYDGFSLAYNLHRWIWPSRFIGVFLMLPTIIIVALSKRRWKKVWTTLFVLFTFFLSYMMEFKMKADVIFLEPTVVKFENKELSKVPLNSIVLGIDFKGVSKAYPVRQLAYHHKVHDTIDEVKVLPTYCTMCRTGRVFSPVVDGKLMKFRLVGARQYNAIVEDYETKSWWHQATGEAIEGKYKGKKLEEIPHEQTTLSNWLNKHPESLILQPDPAFDSTLANYTSYNSSKPKVEYFEKDSLTWDNWNWVIAINTTKGSRAYPWTAVIENRIIYDRVDNIPIMVVAEPDSMSFHIWYESWDGFKHKFKLDSTGEYLTDEDGAKWGMDGICIDGEKAGSKLTPVMCYQEFWHSWLTFHPNTVKWPDPDPGSSRAKEDF